MKYIELFENFKMAKYKKVLLAISNELIKKNYNINFGGCGDFAMVIGKKLFKKDAQFALVYLDEDNEQLVDDLNNLSLATVPFHVYLYINDNLYYDANGFWKLKDIEKEFYDIKVQILKPDNTEYDYPMLNDILIIVDDLTLEQLIVEGEWCDAYSKKDMKKVYEVINKYIKLNF